ncbi:MAG: glycogen debranching enzyme GlgX [Planctomycetes bacterium RBG_16_64_12]|nr:MAG: glycogen debranching enzyme GlgX [Planctomycetes bacterium RBG_16_64_12]
MFERPPSLKFTHPLPYGAIIRESGVQFVVFSRSATAMRVLLYKQVDDREPSEIIPFDRDLNRWGDVWSVFVPGMRPGQLYHYQAEGPFNPDHGHRFHPNARLIDPYAKALAGHFLRADDGIIRPPKCVVVDDEFDWQGDRHLRRDLSESVIYELHVRGFTQSRSSGVKHPGTYRGLIEKIPYLESLGVTAVELMPVHEFPIYDCIGQKLRRPNYWGYDPLALFAPHRGYASGSEPGSQVREFKEMVRALHQAGIEVILDVVFNHTAEGNEQGPTLSFKGLENRVYYMLANGGRHYRNYSGCGNTLNGNHPIVRELIFHCLRHWVHNYHVDGFRFDLASILSRDREGNLLPNPPVVEVIAEDPLLADTKVIAEAWDAAGAYQVGTFASLRWADTFSTPRWAEWNGRYRDDLRRFWRGDSHMIGPLATRLAGSSDLYQPGGRLPYHSINFVTSHDGFTLNDLVSYNEKHNEANGEDNRDGEKHNLSHNYGAEGRTRRKSVEEVRARQIKNFLASLLLSQGVPMLLAGDECRRTQRGNNNAYCQDNAISWLDWSLVKKHEALRRFCQTLIAFRLAEPTVRQEAFLTGRPKRPGGPADISWHNAKGGSVDWGQDSPSLVCLLGAVPREAKYAPPHHHVLLMCHAGLEPRPFRLPPAARQIAWSLFVDTAAEPPNDIYPNLDGPPPPADGLVTLQPRSLVCYVAADL